MAAATKTAVKPKPNRVTVKDLKQAATLQSANGVPANRTLVNRVPVNRVATSQPMVLQNVTSQNNSVRYTPRELARPEATRPTGPRPASVLRRQKWLNFGVVAIMLFLTGRLAQLQLFSPSLAEQARQARMAPLSVLPAKRGQILDRNGVVMATSVDRYQLVADPKAILGFHGNGREDAEGNEVSNGALGVAQLLAPLVDQDPMELAARLNGDNQYVVIAKDLDLATQRAIADLNLKQFIRTEILPKRIYPLGSVAGPLVGFVNFDDQVGQGGIEQRYNEVLAGVDGSKTYERGKNGLPIPGGVYKEVAPINGGDVVLTIDSNLQWKAQEVIDAYVEKFQADYGMVVVQNIKTGELWAVADSGSFDPNVRSEAMKSGSRAVLDTFEPGSTGKIITMAAALETGVVDPYTQFTVPYKYQVPDKRVKPFKDSKDHEVWQLTATGILAKSSNTGMVQIAEFIPREVQGAYLDKFHIGQKTGLNLAGESAGKLIPFDKWDGRTRYTVSFGQGGLTVNAIQATGVYSTVANNGLYTAPSLVLGVQDAKTNKIVAMAEPETSRTIEPDTANTLMKMLEKATDDGGTAKAAQVPGYRVAGKTGTAEIKMPGKPDTIMASFIGVAPADNPEFVVSVFVNHPRTAIYGGTVAAPAFREIMGYLLTQQGLATSTPEQNSLPIYWGATQAKSH